MLAVGIRIRPRAYAKGLFLCITITLNLEICYNIITCHTTVIMQIIYSILVALSILSAPNHTYALSEDNLKDISITQEATRRAEVIKHIETQGKKDCNSIRGLSGELGCYQMLESTMKALAKKHNIEVKGYTYETQEKIVFEEMKSQVAKEIPRKDTFLQWNTGHFGTCSKGVNKYGVSFDSCSYVNKAMKIYSYLFLQ